MPAIDFFKYHGLGNDFILIDAIDRDDPRSLPWAELAPRWCDRNRGIGADGVLVLSRPARDRGGSAADVQMRIINSDGSDAQMCGNGIRCIAKYMVERRRWAEPALRVLTPRGVLAVTCEVSSVSGASRMVSATVDMGEPILEAAAIPVRASTTGPFIEQPVKLGPPFGDGPTTITAVSMGNPHAIVFVDDVASVRLNELGPALEHHALFPKKVNAQFVQVLSRGSARVRTWERGAGPTLACGTGACAVLVAGVLTHRLDREAAIHLPGGDLRIRWDQTTNHVFMTGPAEESFTGSVNRP